MRGNCLKCGANTKIEYTGRINDENMNLCRHCVEEAIRYAIVECEWL